MALFSLTSSPLTISPSSSRKILSDKRSFFSRTVRTTPLPNFQRYPDANNIRFPDFRAQASASMQASSKSNLGVEQAIQQETLSKDENIVFVAGATGKVGSRTVRELLKLGFQVRAGIRSAQKAETLVKSVQQMKLDEHSAVEKLEIVECDLEKDRIKLAIGNASVVICCIGASEKEVFDITGPYRIDYKATKNLIDAATAAGVNHFILLTSLGTNKIGFPAAILNLFWGVLIWKRKAEEELIASGLPYTIVRPGGMERPTDAYKETHNVSLAKEDTLFGGQVSNLQVAELIAFMAKNRSDSYCKVVEVIAETTAPLRSFTDLLSGIPSQRLDSSSAKEPQAVRQPDPAPSQSVLESPISATEKSVQTEMQIPMSLSPYIAYEDLKPPTSPTPTASGSLKVNATVQVVSEPSIAVPKTVVTEMPSAPVEVKETKPLSPYTAYDDWKPPTSPSPDAPTVPQLSASTTEIGSEKSRDSENNTAQPPKLDKTEDTENLAKPKPRPLSPFPMYEDLKPPSSPVLF